MKARKLISPTLLGQIYKRFHYGVPIQRLHRDHGLNNISIPVFTSLIHSYDEYLHQQDKTIKVVIHKSLFPEWLDDIPAVQEQPNEWKYTGKFPYGAWIKR